MGCFDGCTRTTPRILSLSKTPSSTGEGQISANVILRVQQFLCLNVGNSWKFGVGESCQIHRKDNSGKYMECHIRTTMTIVESYHHICFWFCINERFQTRKQSLSNQAILSDSMSIGSMYGIFACIYHKNQPFM